MYILAVMAVLAFSGVYFIFPDYVKPMVAAFSPVSPKEAAHESQSAAGQIPLSVDAAVDIAGSRFPGAELKLVSLPQSDRDSFAVTFRQQDEVQRPRGGRSKAWIDQYSGRVLAERDALGMSAGDAFISWQMPLHSGSAFGLAGRIVICLSGLVCTLLPVTGALIWLRKRKSKAARIRRDEPGAAGAANPQAQSI